MRHALAFLALLPALAGAEPLGLVSVPVEHRALLSTTDLMVEGGTRDALHAHATEAERALLDVLGVPYTVLTTDLSLLRPVRGVARDAQYHDPESMSASLRDLAATFPEIARVIDLGTSWEGRELTGVMLTDNPGVREPDEPSFRVLGTHHGDEWSSMEVAWDVAWTLAGGYGAVPAVTELIDGAEIWIVPVVNPDGVIAFSRRNSRGVDLNRNYGFEWRNQSSSGSAPFSEVETDAMRLMGRRRSFGHSISMHSGATNLGWVWNWSLAPTDDDSVLEALSERYLANTTQPSFYVTNGAAWYITNGDTNDWSYGIRGGHDYTLEISDVKAPPEDELQDFLDFHTEPSVQFLVDGWSTGVRGRVTEPDGNGVEAVITTGQSSQPIYTDPETGAYSRPLSPGAHTLTVEAVGFLATTVTAEVGPVGSGATVVDVTLAPLQTVQVTSSLGLSTSADANGSAFLCDPFIDATATYSLHRPGLGTHPLIAQPYEDGDSTCVLLTLDSAALANDYDAVGEWSLRVQGGADPSTDALLPRAVAFTTPEPSFGIDAVEVTPTAEGEFIVDLLGAGLPEGAELRFVPQDARPRLPAERYVDDGTDTSGVPALSALLSPTDWPEGAVSIRIVGGGEFVAYEGALSVDDGVLTATFAPPGDDDDDDSTAEPADDDDSSVVTDDDDDSTELPANDDDSATVARAPTGCSGCGDSGASGTLALLPLLFLPLSLRRRRISP